MSVTDVVKGFLMEYECIEPGQEVEASESLLELGIIDSVIIKHSIVGFCSKLLKIKIKGFIPCGFIAKVSFNLR